MENVEIVCYCRLAILHLRMRENPNLPSRAGRDFCPGGLRFLEREEGASVAARTETDK